MIVFLCVCVYVFVIVCVCVCVCVCVLVFCVCVCVCVCVCCDGVVVGHYLIGLELAKGETLLISTNSMRGQRNIGMQENVMAALSAMDYGGGEAHVFFSHTMC